MLLVTENLWLTKYCQNIYISTRRARVCGRYIFNSIYLIVNKAFLFLLGGYYGVCWQEYFLSGTISRQTYSNEAILAKCELDTVYIKPCTSEVWSRYIKHKVHACSLYLHHVRRIAVCYNLFLTISLMIMGVSKCTAYPQGS